MNDEERLHRALADAGRRRLLEALAAAAEPLGVRELSAALDLHANTVRWHLRLLEEAGMIARRAFPAQGRGRPRIGWIAVRAPEPAAEYRLLASLLAGSLEGAPDGAARARRTGRAWGEYLVERVEPGRPLDGADSTRRLLELLARHGFAPELAGEVAPDGGATIALHACPFHEVASTHGTVVCGAHQGMTEGALSELGAAVELQELLPFAGPEGCLLRLVTRVDASAD